MDLKDFIKETLGSITNAVIESQKELAETGAIISPDKVEIGKNGKKLLRSDGWRYIQDIEFEVNVVVDKTTTTSGEGKLTVASLFTIGGGESDERQNTSSNIVKFRIPVALPSIPTPEEYKSKRVR